MTENKSAYPTTKIILMYTLLGSYIGGIMLGLCMDIYDLIFNDIKSTFFPVTFRTGLFGILLGFIPALFTSLLIVEKQLHLVDAISYFKLFIIGFIASSLFYFILFSWFSCIHSWLLSIFLCY